MATFKDKKVSNMVDHDWFFSLAQITIVEVCIYIPNLTNASVLKHSLTSGTKNPQFPVELKCMLEEKWWGRPEHFEEVERKIDVDRIKHEN